MRFANLKFTVGSAALLLAMASSPAFGSAETLPADEGAGVGDTADIIVTAQKRSERLTDVPLSITAVSGDSLVRRGVTGAADLERVVTGFSYQPSPYGVPVFAIRGVGFFETSLAVAPTVTVYLDQVPLPFLAMTPGVAFDLERVEALKGPQGTLFGQNSTGGAINYIAAKPTKTFQVGVNAGYGRFNQFDADAFVSGPISETFAARLAVRSEQRDGWQKSFTRDDTLGKRDFLTGRFLLDWTPSDAVRFEFNVNGWRDKSDTQAGQYRQFDQTVPANGRTDAAIALANYPLAPMDIRSADWDAGKSFRRDDSFFQLSLRGDLEMGDVGTLTSITAYSELKARTPTDADGVNFNDLQVNRIGYIHSFAQELRAAGNAGAFKWIVGGNVAVDTSDDNQFVDSIGSNQKFQSILFTGFQNVNHQRVSTWAAFGGLDFQITPTLTAQGSLRYTMQDRNFTGCLRDVGGGLARGFTVVSTLFSGTPTPPLAPGACVSLGADNKPVTIKKDKLDQNNLSWRVGLNWKPIEDMLLYANVTRAYKAGSFGTLPALKASQLTPVVQESLLAYEAGAKMSLLDRRVQVSAAGFYYDYTDKQILGNINTGFPFGNLPGLVTIPKSSIRGGEVEIQARPADGLSLTFGATYVDSKVDGDYSIPDPYGRIVNLNGQQFPNTPKWQIVSDGEYRLPVSDALEVYAGAGVKYRSSSYAAFGQRTLFAIKSYALLDLRAGVQSRDGVWNAQIWGRNVTNKRYLLSASHSVDTVIQLIGMPATYGLTLGYRFR